MVLGATPTNRDLHLLSNIFDQRHRHLINKSEILNNVNNNNLWAASLFNIYFWDSFALYFLDECVRLLLIYTQTNTRRQIHTTTTIVPTNFKEPASFNLSLNDIEIKCQASRISESWTFKDNNKKQKWNKNHGKEMNKQTHIAILNDCLWMIFISSGSMIKYFTVNLVLCAVHLNDKKLA